MDADGSRSKGIARALKKVGIKASIFILSLLTLQFTPYVSHSMIKVYNKIL